MKIGVVGAGFVVKLALEALKNIDNIEVFALWVLPDEKEKALNLAKEYRISEVYTNYDDFLKDQNVEIVHIGVINSKHYEFARKALLSGKPVICEKPFTTSYAQAKDLVEISRSKGLLLVEAVSFLYSPNFAFLMKKILELDSIKIVRSNYSQYSSRYKKYHEGEVLPSFNPLLGGGALYDINIYNLNLILALFGLPISVNYFANIGFNGVDTSGVALLKYPGFIAECCGAKDSASPCETIIQAENGYIKLEGPPNLFRKVESVINGCVDHYSKNDFESHMTYEFIAFERMFRGFEPELINERLELTLNVMKVAEDCRKNIGLIFPGDK